jgi:glycosyltransferase involved in cell wall biosynthesis
VGTDDFNVMDAHGSPAIDLITVGITCFNASDSLERAVRSAQAQIWPAIEIVAVDDGSTDGSPVILERLARDDRRIRVIRHAENRGVAAARNTVLRNATGAFVAFFDDDDESLPERLTAQHERIVDYERAARADRVLCYTATEQRYPDGKCRYSSTLGMDVTPAPSGMEVARLILLGKPVRGGPGTCPTSSLMARSETLRIAGEFDEALRRHEDTDLNLRLALQGAHFAGLSRAMVVQTVTFAADKTLQVDRQNFIEFTRKHRELLQEWSWYEFSLNWNEMKFDILQHGMRRALPQMMRLVFMSPSKFVRKVAWSFPNRSAYRKYGYPRGRDGQQDGG